MSALKSAVLFTAAMAGHWLWTTHFSIWGLAPQLTLVLTVAAAARLGPVRAMLLGFGWGLFLDVLTVRLFGANALALVLVGYGTGSVRRQIDVTGSGPQGVVVLFMTWAYFLTMAILGLVFARSFVWPGWASVVLIPFYNALVAAVVAVLWRPVRER